MDSDQSRVNFPRISQLLNSRRDLVELIKANFEREVGRGPILLVSGNRATKAYAEVYRGLLREAWGVEPEHRILARAPDLSEAETLANEVLDRRPAEQPKLVVYVGGQTVGDSTKVIVHRMREAIRKERRDETVILGGIITSLSNDGTFSVTASVRDRDGLPKSFATEAPDFVVGHLLTLLRQPYVMKISCVGDVLAKISSLWDYNYSCRVLEKYHNDFAADLTVSAYEVVTHSTMSREFLHNPESIKALYRSVQLCGLSMQLAKSSETCSGAEHVGQKWLDEYVTRYNALVPAADHLPLLGHGEAVTPMTIVALYLQGNASEAELVKRIAEAIGLKYRVQALRLPAIVLQACLTFGLGFRCPRYLAHVLLGMPLPKGDPGERLTILEELEAEVLPHAIKTAMIDSGVAQDGDFVELGGVDRIVMEQVFKSALLHSQELAGTHFGSDAAKQVATKLVALSHKVLP